MFVVFGLFGSDSAHCFVFVGLWVHILNISDFLDPYPEHLLFVDLLGPYAEHLCFYLLAVYRPWEVSHRYSCEIDRRMHYTSCLVTPWVLRYEHVC